MRRNSYIKDINGHCLYEDDIVYYIVKRCSSSYSTWGQITNKGDGHFRIKGKIVFKNNGFYIVGDEGLINTLKMASGKEQGERNVWFEEFLLSEYLNISFGKDFSKGYIEKITNRKKKKVVSNRLEALGIA